MPAATKRYLESCRRLLTNSLLNDSSNRAGDFSRPQLLSDARNLAGDFSRPTLRFGRSK
jgi:hypothetical protein